MQNDEPRPSITEESLTEFKKLHKAEFGMQLSNEEAHADAISLAEHGFLSFSLELGA